MGGEGGEDPDSLGLGDGGDELDLGADDSEPEADFGGKGEDEEEEDFDIEEILREIEAELSGEDEAELATENAKLKEELSDYRKAVELPPELQRPFYSGILGSFGLY
jgi:hypothetical protein